MPLHDLKPAPGSRPSRQIVGRGEGSGWGQTAGKGQKGQSCRSGETIMVGFEGGQMPLIRRIPKRGFNHASKIYYQSINLDQLEESFEVGAEVNKETLLTSGLLRKTTVSYKILGRGSLTKKLKVTATKFSKSAEEAVLKAGGQVVKA